MREHNFVWRKLVKAVAVAAGNLAQTLPLGELRKKVVNFQEEESPASALLADFEQVLFGFQLERQARGHLKGQGNFVIAAGHNPGLAENEIVANLESLDQICFLLGILRYGIFRQIFGDDFLVFPFIQYFNYAKQRAAFAQDIAASIGIFFELLDDFSCAARLYDSRFSRKNYAHFEVLFDTSRDHDSVAGFENVQREGHTGEKHNLQREQRNASRSHLCRAKMKCQTTLFLLA